MKSKILSIWTKLKVLFKQGLTPKQLALSLVISLVVSLFPIFGISTIVLMCIAIPLKLNVPIMIASSYLFEPIKLFVIVPFINLGGRIFGADHTLLTYETIKASYNENFFETVKSLSYELICGALGWLLTALPIGLILYVLLKTILTYFDKLKTNRKTTS